MKSEAFVNFFFNWVNQAMRNKAFVRMALPAPYEEKLESNGNAKLSLLDVTLFPLRH